jgi:hypothetical protein
MSHAEGKRNINAKPRNAFGSVIHTGNADQIN